jgi:hypothetical protein
MRRDEEPTCDLAVGAPAGELADHVTLPVREPMETVLERCPPGLGGEVGGEGLDEPAGHRGETDADSDPTKPEADQSPQVDL